MATTRTARQLGRTAQDRRDWGGQAAAARYQGSTDAISATDDGLLKAKLLPHCQQRKCLEQFSASDDAMHICRYVT
jgi:hypothetical protein